MSAFFDSHNGYPVKLQAARDLLPLQLARSGVLEDHLASCPHPSGELVRRGLHRICAIWLVSCFVRKQLAEVKTIGRLGEVEFVQDDGGSRGWPQTSRLGSGEDVSLRVISWREIGLLGR